MKNICTLLFFVFIAYSGFCQNLENRIGLNYGIQFGGYIPSNKEASFYDGKLDKEATLLEILTVQYNYDQIASYYYDDFEIYEYPAMKYTPNISIGGILQYYTNETFAIYSSVNFTKLNAQGIFLIELDSPQQGSSIGDNTEEGIIEATESRFNFDVGIHYVLAKDKKYLPYFECGASGSLLETESHTVKLGDFESSFYYNNTIDSKSLASAFGYGMQLGTGIQFAVKKFYIYTGVSIDFIRYGIVDNSFSSQKSVSIKILL